MKTYTSPRINTQTNNIEFYLSIQHARQVALSGSFNHWARNLLLEAHPDEEGIWQIEIPMVPPGRYEYKFLIDEKLWIEDINNPLREPDGFGGFNSILEIEP